MTSKLLISLLTALTFSTPAWTQTFRNKEVLIEKKIDKMNSEKQILNLKEGALLVRLSTKQPTLDALRERGKTVVADQIEAEQKRRNLLIISAFNTYFDFCKVYYFYSYDSELVKENKLDSVCFLDDRLMEDKTIEVVEDYRLVADISYLRPDTSYVVTGTYLHEGEDGLELRERRAVNSNFGFEALRFLSQELYQLRKPFPYYTRTLQSLPVFRRKYDKVVRMANKELTYYYNKINA